MAASSDCSGGTTSGTQMPCFQLLDEDELLEFVEGNDSKNTKKQIKYGLSVFLDFCGQTNANFNNDIDDEALDRLLSQFYAGARNKSGDLYSKKTMQAIRFSLQRYFLETRQVDITKDEKFSKCGKTFQALMIKLKATGKAAVKHHPAIYTEEDMTKILNSLDLSSADGLQKKVFLDTMLYFARNGEPKKHDARRFYFPWSWQQ